MVIAIKTTIAPHKGCLADPGDQADANKASENRDRVYQMMRAAARIGMFYRSAGDPSTTTKPIAAGAFCIDTTNDEVYVCTNRDTPTWTKLEE